MTGRPAPPRPAAPSEGEATRSRVRAFLGLSLLAALVFPLVLLLGRDELARSAAAVAAATEALVLVALAALEERRAPAWLRDGLLLSAALLTAPVAWFFGPNGGMAALVALLVLLTGLLARPGSRAGWLVYLGLAGGELAVVVLVLSRVLPDRSLARVIVPGHPDWQHLFAHLAVQGVHLGSFLAGRVLRDRYAEVRAELERLHRDAAVKTALLDEARADYRRAVRALKRGALSRAGVVRISDPPPSPSPEPPSPSAEKAAPPSATTTGTHATRLLMDAYKLRIERQHLATLALCVVGSVILAVIGRDERAQLAGILAMAAIAGLALLQRSDARRRGDESAYWPWALIAALSVGPAFAFGLHSAFSCVIAALLFFGGFFRAAPGAARRARRLPVYLAVALGHGTAFALVALGVLPDAGNLPILGPEHRPLEPLALHLALQGIYAAAFGGGWLLDARFEAVLRQAAAEERAASSRNEALRRTGAAIERALEGTKGGLFTGERVGRYTVGRLIASGAMGDVYEAQGAGSGPVALKLVRADKADDPIALELLAREAGALGRIRSAHVARILEAGVDQELPYVAMELIEGESLAEVLRERPRLSLERARELARDLCAGIRDVHDAGVIHRDLKPHNVMRTRAGQWKIVDFGLALEGLGAPDRRGGTAAYMAPEQLGGQRIDVRADLYSTCLVLYRALTGRPAFVGEEPEAAAARAAPPDPRALAAMPEALALVLRVGLAEGPKDRFATARELAAALDAAFDDRISDKHRERALRVLAESPWSAV